MIKKNMTLRILDREGALILREELQQGPRDLVVVRFHCICICCCFGNCISSMVVRGGDILDDHFLKH